MFDVILSLSLSFAITFFSIPAIIKVAELKKLYDVPDARKVHRTPIPSLGGLGIFSGFILATLISVPRGSLIDFQYFTAAAFIIFLVGVKDDILIISPIKKLIGQIAAAAIIIHKGGIQITSMHGFLGVYELPEMFSLALTYFTIILIINSFNLIDGVDGLAGSLAVLSCSIFGLYFIAVEQIPYAILAFALAGSMLAFLIFNFNPARIFMGDTGSLLTGLVTSILVIKFININEPLAIIPAGGAPAIGIAILIVPLVDTLRVFSIRILNRRSPFSPDRNHIHHILLDYKLDHKTISLLLVGMNVLFVVLAIIGTHLVGATATAFIAVGLAYGAFTLAWYNKPKTRIYVTKNGEAQTEILSKRSIFAITKEKLQ